jgi:hypothetical protein
MPGKKFVIKIRWGEKQTRAENYDLKDPNSCQEYSFGTKKEAEAFLRGVGEAVGWTDYDYTDDEATEWEDDGSEND